MDKVTLYEFENEQAFENYLIADAFQGWDFFQESIISEPYRIFGLLDGDRLVSAVKINKDALGDIRILAMQTRNDLQHKGYGTKLLQKIMEKFGECMLVKWTEKSLSFWIKQGFQFTINFDYMVK